MNIGDRVRIRCQLNAPEKFALAVSVLWFVTLVLVVFGGA